MQRLFVVGAGLLSATSGLETEKCNACMAASTELIKRTPILKRAGVKDDDKALAVGEAFENFCSTYNFHAYTEDASKFEAACRSFVKEHNGEGALQTKLASGQSPLEVCSTACEGVPEAERLTSYTPVPKAKASKKATEDKASASKAKPKSSSTASKGRKGTVDDPAYKEAFKRKAARDAKKKAAAAAAKEDGEEQDL